MRSVHPKDAAREELSQGKGWVRSDASEIQACGSQRASSAAASLWFEGQSSGDVSMLVLTGGAGAVLTTGSSPKSTVPGLPARNPSSFHHNLLVSENPALVLHVVPEG